MSNLKQNFKTVAQFDIRPVSKCNKPKNAKFLGDCNLIEAGHDIGCKSGVYTAAWKSEAWKKMTAVTSKLTSAALREKLELSKNVSVTFSAYAGCSMCPCSPGFVIRGKNFEGKKELSEKQLAGTHIFGSLKFDKQTIENFKNNEGEAFLAAFAAEQKNHKL